MLSETYTWLTTHGYEWATSQLQNNDFLVGFLSTGILAGATFFCRSLPSRAYYGLKNLSSIKLVINSSMRDYDKINEFLVEKIIWQKIQRHYIFDYNRTAERNVLGPGYGWHLGNYGLAIVTIDRQLQQNSVSESFKEQTTITIYSRKQKTLHSFIEDLSNHIQNFDIRETITIYSSDRDYWYKIVSKPIRTFESLFIPEKTKQSIIEHFEGFLSDKDRLTKLGLPYHTGMFISGTPGCGKSSLIHVIASHLKRNLYYMNLGDIKTDKTLIDIMGGISCDQGILVIEDIDAIRAEVKKRKSNSDNNSGPSVSLSTILNVLDGLLTPHGLIVIATSNHKNVLDPALIRRGRFDLQIELGPMEWKEFYQMGIAYGIPKDKILSMKSGYKPIPAVEARNKLMECNI